ncbi:MAG TPA: GDP-mannose 4,6-dehydratase [Bacteroidales bacterium]|nr:GDP-mannose 4,6-dehydratase [Bacteroidales bacterium]
MRFLITGGCGFLGSNLAYNILDKNEELFVFDNLSRFGSEKNLKWLKRQGEFKFYQSDIRNQSKVEDCIKKIKPDVIFHLAGQVAMTTSIENPRLDFEVNALGTLNVLESVKKYCPNSLIIYSSTNKVYGDLEYFSYEETETRYICKEHPNGFNESIKLDFHSPYGCSKGAADQYMIDYNRIFGLRTIVLRHSSMFGGRQFATFDQGWIGWFCRKAIEEKKGILKEPFTISGNGKQVRDVLFIDDIIVLYNKLLIYCDRCIGNAFNIGGGINNSLSLLELFNFIEDELGISLKFNKLLPRKSDQKVFIADINKIKSYTGWIPQKEKYYGIRNMLKLVENG